MLRERLQEEVKLALRAAQLRLAWPAPGVKLALRAARLRLVWPAPGVKPALRAAQLRLAWQAARLPRALRPGRLPAMPFPSTRLAPPRNWETLPAWAKVAVRPYRRWSCPPSGHRSTSPW